MTKSPATWLGVASAVVLGFSATLVAAPQRVEWKHFSIAYDSSTSSAYVNLVRRGLEEAYDVFVADGPFASFDAAVEVRIPTVYDEGMGAEYLEADRDGDPVPVIEIAPEAVMLSLAGGSAIGLSLENAVLSTTAHEFFHVLQDYASLHGQGDVSEEAFVEPLATAAQDVAAPRADDYLDAAAEFLLAPDSASFLDRGYDAGVFWVFVLDRYGGLDVLRRVMASSAAFDGTSAIDAAFAPQGITFLDVWAKFAAALAVGALPDAAAFAKLERAYRNMAGAPDLSLPPTVAVARWTGRPTTLDRATEPSPAVEILGYSDATPGETLKIAYPYGIDVIAIRPESPTPLSIEIVASTTPELRVAFAGRRGAEWKLLSLVGRRLDVRSPERFDEIRIVLTRGESGPGTYTVQLSPAPSVHPCATPGPRHTIAALEG